MKKALIVVDYQNDFVNGSLGFDKAILLEEAICCKIKEYQSQQQTVLFTMDTHKPNYLDTQEGKKLPIEHCIENTYGWELYGKVKNLLAHDAVCFCKNTFGSLSLAEYLKEQQFDSVELCGLVSNICVLSNAVLAKAALPEAEIIVDANCTASNDETLNQKALDVLTGLQVTIKQ